jgi:SM-20-related protein
VPGADFFSGLGIFTARGFLDQETCARLRSEIRAAETVPGAVGASAGDHRVDVKSRRTSIAELSSEVRDIIGDRLDLATPEIERYFSLEVNGRESLQFLVYREGDFFEAHRDRNPTPEGSPASKPWRVSVVIFLNHEAPEPAPEAYAGGALTFYGLLGGERGEQVGLPLVAETGLLVAFPSDLAHAVTPVTHGERYTVVTWLV